MQKSMYTSATIKTIAPMCAGSTIYELSLVVDENLGKWKAGQFIMLQLGKEEYSFARPFSIASTNYEELVLYVQCRGKETNKIPHLAIGEKVHLWGALGNAFSSPNKKTLIIAGGIGIAPFVLYTNEYSTNNGTAIELLFGHRLPLENYPMHMLGEKTNIQTFLDTDAQSLQYFLQSIEKRMVEYSDGQVLACGPLPLLKYIQNIAKKYEIYTEISLEETMFCGVGACLGCVCKINEEFSRKEYERTYVQTCTLGPVFPSHTIVL